MTLKNARPVGWVEARNPTKTEMLGCASLNPTYGTEKTYMKIPFTSLSIRMPSASHIPPVTLYWLRRFRAGFRRGQGVERKRDIPPANIGTIRALAEIMILPVRLITTIVEQTKEQAEEERGEIDGHRDKSKNNE